MEGNKEAMMIQHRSLPRCLLGATVSRTAFQLAVMLANSEEEFGDYERR